MYLINTANVKKYKQDFLFNNISLQQQYIKTIALRQEPIHSFPVEMNKTSIHA